MILRILKTTIITKVNKETTIKIPKNGNQDNGNGKDKMREETTIKIFVLSPSPKSPSFPLIIINRKLNQKHEKTRNLKSHN